jgi:hypothetical protein
MTIYYRDADVQITQEAVFIDGFGYRLDRLDAVWIERGYVHVSRTLAVLVLRLLVAVGAVALLAGVTVLLLRGRTPIVGQFDPSVRSAIGWGSLLGGPVVMAILVYSAERVHDLGTREQCLCAQVDGASVLLVNTTNATRFGQIHRALVRALEHARR